LNSHKIIDEYISRFPDGVVSSVLDVLISAMTKAKTIYLQGESYRLLELILKRFHQLQDHENKGRVLGRYGQILENIFEIFHSLDEVLSSSEVVTGGGSGPLKVKRFKPLLQLTKTLFGFLKSMFRCDGSSAESRSYDLLLALPNADDKQRIPLSVSLVRQMKEVFVSAVDGTAGGAKGSKGVEQSEKMETEGVKELSHPYVHLFRWIKQNPSLKGIFEQLHHQIRDIPSPSALLVQQTPVSKISTVVSSSKKTKEPKASKTKTKERDYERELVQSYREMSDLKVSSGEAETEKGKGKESKKRGVPDAVEKAGGESESSSRVEEGESEGKRKKVKKEKKVKGVAAS
jgi:hypothetical protein